MRRLTSNTNRVCRQYGAAALETILLMPLVLGLLFMMAHYSLIFVTIQLFNFTVEEALRQGVRYVDEECYYGGGCDSSALQAQLESNADAILHGLTGDSLFGQTLDDKFTSTASLLDSGGCCQLMVSYPYSEAPFLPVFLDFTIPNTLSASAVLEY
ncbi:TadE/TadG family type IV pilus assembly protein [Photobacterium rosenbergii]|uniref:TadE/TadG family type IV pilus assembly protein n=1 Tax=Photobacterium rosenbergii TaxID=294936 RepID=A0ABU3ZEZ8_9GAMM|nr:TadE/TadG family type IV pilus assembly protein [Photobacterium rosenbergii]MDV5168678.1 TadE/TadG family type IV pilus assembly protein [Photobacterium rosenbergii]